MDVSGGCQFEIGFYFYSSIFNNKEKDLEKERSRHSYKEGFINRVRSL